MISVNKEHITTEGNGLDLMGEASLATAVTIERVSHDNNTVAETLLVGLIQTAGDILKQRDIDVDLKRIGRYLSVFGGDNDTEN